jgi:hypothetical protein
MNLCRNDENFWLSEFFRRPAETFVAGFQLAVSIAQAQTKPVFVRGVGLGVMAIINPT